MPLARCLFLFALFALSGLSCEPADDVRPPTCEAVGAHLSEICMSNVFGEGVRLDCQAFGIESAARRCLMRATQCASALNDCRVTDIVATCATATDCSTPLVCDLDMQKCTECSPDVLCPTGKSCFGGVCAAGP